MGFDTVLGISIVRFGWRLRLVVVLLLLRFLVFGPSRRTASAISSSFVKFPLFDIAEASKNGKVCDK